MNDHLDDIQEAQRILEQRAELSRLVKDLTEIVKAHRWSAGAARELVTEARELHELEYRYDVCAWPRPVADVGRLFDLTARIRELESARNQGGEQAEELFTTEEEYATLCGELGVEQALGNPDQHLIKAIAEAVAAGAEPTRAGRPADWSDHWLHEAEPWDPDYYIAKVAYRHLDYAGAMLLASEDSRLRLAHSVLLAVAESRAVILGLLSAAEEKETGVAGRTQRLHGLIARGRSAPSRGWISDSPGWSEEFSDTNWRGVFRVQVERGERGLRNANDFGGALTTIGHANLDAYVLVVMRVLLPILRDSEGSAKSTGEGGDADPGDTSPSVDPQEWIPKKRLAYEECCALQPESWVSELWAQDYRIVRSLFRGWTRKLEKGTQYRHDAGGVCEIKREPLLEMIARWKARP